MKQCIFNRGDAIKAVAWLSSFIAGITDNRQYVISVKQYHKKRSLDANAYCWVLIDRLAEETRLKKSEIYRSAVREIGGNSETVCVKNSAVDKICRGWEHNGEGWQAERSKSKIPG